MLYFFSIMIPSKTSRVLLFFQCFAILLVHYYTLAVVAPISVAQATVTTHAQEAEPHPSKIFSVLLGNSDYGHSVSFTNHAQEVEPEISSEKKEEFRPCRVSNKTYYHREQIPRIDPCETCVCLDSQMYCFWKMCAFLNLTTSTPAPSTTSMKKQEIIIKQSVSDNNITSWSTKATETKAKKPETTDEKFSKILKDQRKYNALKKLEATSPKNVEAKNIQKEIISTSTDKSTVCYVMGVMYKYGEVLPRDTGTCLECACSEGGRVSCSPKDCVSQPDLDYLSHNNNLDMFDLDTF